MKFNLLIAALASTVAADDEDMPDIGLNPFPEYDNLVQNDGKVHIDIYYESLCSGCRMKMDKSYLPAINTPGFFDMADIRIFPFGNTNEYYD